MDPRRCGDDRRDEKMKTSTVLIVYVLALLAAVAVSIVFLSAPLSHLLGGSEYAIRGAMHGLLAGIMMVAVTIGLYQAARLWIGSEIHVKELQIGSVINSTVCFFTILFGNWLYIPYRAEQGPRAFFLKITPEIHKIFFEFKEFVALFTFPLLVAATYIIWTYGDRLQENKALRISVSLLLLLGFFYFLVAFGLGAAITKLKAV